MENYVGLPTRGELLKSCGAMCGVLAAPSAGGALTPLESEESAYRARAYNGGTDPYPIPWLDRNGSHNRPAGPDTELSHIYHFKGNVARCSGFTGIGTDNKGNRIPFGSPTTDFGWMSGEYWAARRPQQGAFVHI